jgi:hypothetical protein
MKIITFSGKAQHGKDTTAKYVKETLQSYGKKVVILHFADYLKYVCKEYFNWNGIKDEEGRTILQKVGTDLARKNNPDIWVNVVSDFILAFKTEFDYFLVPDCRFPNEIDLLKEKYYEVYSIFVERSEFNNGLTELQKSHPSETALDDYQFDITLINQEGLDYVKNNAIEISKIIEFYSKK